MGVPLQSYDLTLYRIAFAQYAARVLEGVIHPEGRFHHAGQAALYASPSPEAAAIAIQTYVSAGDAPRVLVRLQLRNARLADLRDPDCCAALGIDPAWPSVPWADERRAGQPATSWKASDAVRNSGADGMIYASRKEPARWHVVLFSWNETGAAQVTQEGPPTSWVPHSV